MATTDYKDEISKLLRCSICLEILDNPKSLTCQHSFCKRCLDNLLQFRDFGCAVLTCPYRCEKTTFIKPNETTEDLPTPYQLKQILELHTKQPTSAPSVEASHCDSPSCVSAPTSCCTKCYKLFCSPCQEDHSKSHVELAGAKPSYLSIKYDNRHDKYVVLCTKHLASADYICKCSMNSFICVYCKQRDHQHHGCINIGETANEIKDKLNGDILRNSILQNIFSISKQTKTLIPECRKLLMDTLRIRKVKELSSYISRLNDEELRLIGRFDALSSAHLQNYNADDMKTIIEDFERIRKEEDFQVVIKRKNIMDIFKKYTNITSVKLTLSEKQSAEYPLGDFSLEYDIASDVEKETKFAHNLTVITDVEEEMKKLMENLNDLLPEEHLLTNTCETNGDGYPADIEGSCCYNEQFCSAALKKLENEGLPYVENLIKHNRVQIIKMILQTKDKASELINMKDNDGLTPLSYAVKYNNLSIYKLLLLHGTTDDDSKELVEEGPLLHLAAEYNSSSILSYILSKDVCDVNLDNDVGSTPIHVAACGGHLHSIRVLIKYGCDIHRKNYFGMSALNYARHYNYQAAELLMKSSFCAYVL